MALAFELEGRDRMETVYKVAAYGVYFLFALLLGFVAAVLYLY